MNDVDWITRIPKAGRKALDEPNGLVRLAAQQGAGVRGHHAPVEIRHNATAAGPSEINVVCATLRLHRGPLESVWPLASLRQQCNRRGDDRARFRTAPRCAPPVPDHEMTLVQISAGGRTRSLSTTVIRMPPTYLHETPIQN
jgi:hypothetical protein